MGDRWFLVEAKANRPEFVAPGSRSEGEPRRQIERSLNRTKRSLGVHRYFSWIDSYFQYANRLTIVDFVREHGIDARLVFVYLVGDCFPDGMPCPASEAEWKRPIEARRLTLGLPRKHRLSTYEPTSSCLRPSAGQDARRRCRVARSRRDPEQWARLRPTRQLTRVRRERLRGRRGLRATHAGHVSSASSSPNSADPRNASQAFAISGLTL